MLLHSVKPPIDRTTPTGELAITIERAAQETRIQLRGEITRITIQPLIDAVRDALGSGSARVRICLRRVSVLDNGGLTALAVAARMADDAGAVLTIEHPSPFAARILEMAGLAQLYERASVADQF